MIITYSKAFFGCRRGVKTQGHEIWNSVTWCIQNVTFCKSLKLFLCKYQKTFPLNILHFYKYNHQKTFTLSASSLIPNPLTKSRYWLLSFCYQDIQYLSGIKGFFTWGWPMNWPRLWPSSTNSDSMAVLHSCNVSA